MEEFSEMDFSKEVFELVKKELERAKKEHGKTFNSPHEAYGVMAEEISEAGIEGNGVFELFGTIYDSGMIVKLHNDDLAGQFELYLDIERRARAAAMEFIQIAAVARKAVESECFKPDEYWDKPSGKEKTHD